jgi:hypothetical protein
MADPNTAVTGPVGQAFLPAGQMPATTMQDELVRRWTGPTGQTDWTRVVQQGGTAPIGIPIDYDLLQREGWARQDSSVFMQQYLRSLGLEDMAGWANQMIVLGASPEMVQLQLWDQPAFKKRFAGIFQFQQNFPDFVPPSPAEVLSWERDAASMMHQAGLPEGFYDSPTDFQDFIGKGVSLKELSTRINDAFLVLDQGPQQTIDELQRLYGVGRGGLAAWALDEDRAVPTILKQVQAVQIGTFARPAGYTLDASTLENLAAYGVTQSAAQQGFSQLYGMRELFGALPGEGVGGISQAQQLGATFTGDVAAQEAIQRRGESRAAVFGEAGGAIFDQRGSGTFR